MLEQSTLVTVVKLTENLEVGDCLLVGGVFVNILQIQVNDHDEMVINATIAGAPNKKRSRMTVIIPKKIPVSILKFI